LIQLRSGSSEAMLLPHLGGAIGSFAVGGKAALRPTPAHVQMPFEVVRRKTGQR
jgi:aldose 1-epimerase